MASWRIRFHDKWPHLASLYASTHNLDEEGKYPDPIMGQDNVFDPSEPYGAYRYYIQPTARSEFSLEEPTYVNRPVYKDEESRSSDYTSGASLKRGSTCRVLLCVFLVLSFIGVVVAAVTLAVLLSKTPRSSKITQAPVEEYESMASLLGRTFNETLLDKNSDDFKQLEKELCIALEQIFKEHDSPVKHEFVGCEVIEFAEGSVLARFRIKLQPKLPDGFKQELRIRQKIEEHFARKIKEHGPWQSVKFNPNFIRRFVKIEPPKVETRPPTTMPTKRDTTPIQTMRPRLINITTDPITSKDDTTEAELTTTNATITKDASTMQATEMSDSTAETDLTSIMTKVTEIVKTTEKIGVQTTDSISNITESTEIVSDTVTQIPEIPTVSKITETAVVNMTVPETATGVTKKSKVTTTFGTVINATTTTIDPFLFIENMTFPLNDSSSTEVLMETSAPDIVTKTDGITTATVDSGIITTTAKTETASTTLKSDTSSIVGVGEMNVTDMTQAPFTSDGPIGITIASVENVTSVTSLDITQTGAVTEILSTRDQTMEKLTTTSGTDSTPISATTISVLKETTDFGKDLTLVPEMTTLIKAAPDIATVTTTTISSPSLEKITEGLTTAVPIGTTSDIHSETNKTTMVFTDSITTVQDITTLLESTDTLILDTTVKPVISSSSRDKVTTASIPTTGSMLTTQTVPEISTIAEASNLTNVTEQIFDFFETSTVENVTEADLVFITETTTNETLTADDQVVPKTTTSTKDITQTISTDSALMKTIPQEDVNGTTTSKETYTIDSMPTTLGADTLTFESLIPVQTHNLTTDIQILSTTNATDEVILTTQVKNETVQRETVAAFDSAPQTFIMPDVTLRTTKTTEGPTTMALKTTTMAEQPIATEPLATDVGVTTAEGTTVQFLTELTAAAEGTLIPETTPRETFTSQEATFAIETGFTTVVADLSQIGTSSETVTGITTITTELTSKSFASTPGPETTSATEKPTRVSDMTTSVITSVSQTEVQNLTTIEVFENTTAPEIMITATDLFNDTFQTDPYMDNITLSEVFVTTTTSSRNLTTTTDSLTEQTTKQISAGASVTDSDHTATSSTEILTKQDITTATVPDSTTIDVSQVSTGQSTQYTIQSTDGTETTAETISTMLTTGQDSITTERLVNETQTTSQPLSQTTVVDTVTSSNMTFDFTTEEILLDNVTSTEMMDFLNFTTTSTQTDKPTSVQLTSSTLVSNETVFQTTPSSEKGTTASLDKLISPEQTTSTTIEAGISTVSSNKSTATTLIATDSITTADTITQTAEITEMATTLSATDAAGTDTVTTADSLTQSPQLTELATTIITAATVNQTVTEIDLITDPSGTAATDNVTQEGAVIPLVTSQTVTTSIDVTTRSLAVDITEARQQTKIASTLIEAVTTLKPMNESTDTTVTTGVEMATTDTLLDFTDMTNNFTDMYANVTDGFITDVITTRTTSLTDDSTTMNTTVAAEQAQTIVTESSVSSNITAFVTESYIKNTTSTTEQLTTEDTQTTKMPSANTTKDSIMTTHVVNITDASFVDDNITIATEPTQATIQSNVTDSSENITRESFTTEQFFNITTSSSADINTTFIEEFTTDESVHSNITTTPSVNITTKTITAQEPTNSTSAPSGASNSSETFNATESPFFDNSTLIYDMTYDNTTDYYYLNETITSANPNVTVSNYTTVLTSDSTVSYITEGSILSNNDTNSSSNALTGAVAKSNDSILPVS